MKLKRKWLLSFVFAIVMVFALPEVATSLSCYSDRADRAGSGAPLWDGRVAASELTPLLDPLWPQFETTVHQHLQFNAFSKPAI